MCSTFVSVCVASSAASLERSEPTACMDCGAGDKGATNHTICDACLDRRYPEK